MISSGRGATGAFAFERHEAASIELSAKDRENARSCHFLPSAAICASPAPGQRA
jgi:hypothetical protein